MLIWIYFYLMSGSELKAGVSAAGSNTFEEVCLMETFLAKCGPNEVVIMDSALYGRMRNGHCAPLGSGPLGCVTDVTQYMHSQCSARRRCNVKVGDDTLHELNSCARGFMPYLEASYECLPVLGGLKYASECRSSGHVVITGLSSGIIASSVVLDTRAGAGLCPWTIHVQPGQRMNITLVDFGAQATGRIDEAYSTTCRKYASLWEQPGPSSTTICSGVRRTRDVYISKTHQVEIQFVDTLGTNAEANFLLKFNALGCADPDLRGNYLVERTVDHATLQCRRTGQKTYIVCSEQTWNAPVPECPHSADYVGSGKEWSNAQVGVAVITGVGLIVGVVVGLSLLLCAVLWIRWRQKKRLLSRSIYYDDYDSTKERDINEKLDPIDAPVRTDNMYERQRIAAGKAARYAQIWNPVNRDVIILEEIPRRLDNLCDIGHMSMHHGQSDTLSLATSSCDGRPDHVSGHVYERPL